MNDYLWDGSGEKDPEVAALEDTLRPLRARPQTPPRLPQPRLWTRSLVPFASAAAALLLFVALGKQGGEEGEAVVITRDGAVVDVGEVIEEGLLQLGAHGHVVVQPRSRVAVVKSTVRGQELSLEKGALSAVVDAPPRFFVVATPAVRAVDLGCAYDLAVDDAGATHLRVTSGIVELAGAGVVSQVPRGASAVTKAGGAPGVPFFSGATPQFLDALAAGNVDEMIALAQKHDAVTLWHLLGRVDGEPRARVLARLQELLGSGEEDADVLWPLVRTSLLPPWEQ